MTGEEKEISGSLMIPKSPSLIKRELEHKIDIENKQIEKSWKSCCGLVMDSAPIQYFTTIGIISGIMSFCIYKLSTNESCEAQQLYTGLLTMLIGLILPGPIYKKNK